MPPDLATILLALHTRARQARRRAVCWFVICSLALFAASSTLLLLIVDSTTFDPCPPRIQAASNDARNLSHAAEQFMLQNAGRCPRDVPEMVKMGILPRQRKDPWGHPFTLTCLPDRTEVCSAGPDPDDPADDICEHSTP